MLTILESMPSIREAFVVHIPNSLAVPSALQTPYVNVVFDVDTQQSFFVRGEVECKGEEWTTTYGILYKGHPTLSLGYYLDTGLPLKLKPQPFLARYYSKDYQHILDINSKLPLAKWLEYAEDFFALYNSVDWVKVRQVNLQQYSSFIHSLVSIEKAGLKVDPYLFQKHFEQPPYVGNFAYSRYNPYTVTGRPSNAYNHINFAALNKEDGSRSAFVSRFANGKLIEIDFRSYHVHLVADLIGYEFECEDIHTYFGQLYFGTQDLTPQQYEESKTRTFKALYSNDKPSHPFFDGIRALAEVLFKEYQTTGAILTPIFNRRITGIAEASINKVFNYFIQCYETERNASVLQEVLAILEEYSSRLVLYTYDSILIDFNREDGAGLFEKIMLSIKAQKYPFSVSVGTNYGDMRKIDI